MSTNGCTCAARVATIASILSMTSVALATETATATASGPVLLDSDQLRATRCSLDDRTIYFVGTGNVYANVPGQAPTKLFGFIGVDISRCVPNAAGGWTLASRELSYYLDPKTGEIIHRWRNPWSSETVTVMHIANRLQQLDLPPSVPLADASPIATLVLELPFAIPNPLAAQFPDYMPEPLIPSVSSYKFSFDRRQLETGRDVAHVALTYFETGPWRPWMKMGSRPGELVYSITGHKVSRFEQLPAVVKHEIDTRLPLFREAPSCKVAAANQNTWTEFAADFDAYQRGDRFPLPAPIVAEPCAP